MNEENCDLLGYYAASSGNILQTLRTMYPSYLQESRIQKRMRRWARYFIPKRR